MRGLSHSLKKDLAEQGVDRRHFIKFVGKESFLVADRIRRECVVSIERRRRACISVPS